MLNAQCSGLDMRNYDYNQDVHYSDASCVHPRPSPSPWKPLQYAFYDCRGSSIEVEPNGVSTSVSGVFHLAWG